VGSRGTTKQQIIRLAWVAIAGGLLVVGMSQVSNAASQAVDVIDNRFNPQEIRVDPGDTVIWTNRGQNQHDIRADDGDSFRSGLMGTTDQFRHRFTEEGFYYYHCNLHGSRKKVGMWGLVVVGNPDPKTDPYIDLGSGAKDVRPKLVVPRDFKTIQGAVDKANPGSTILVRPGVYKTSVTVQTPNLIIKGVDRFRTVLDGEDKRGNGITVDGTRNVRIENLTVRNYLGNGVYINNTVGYTVNKVDAIKGRTYGIYAFDSYDGVIKNSYAYGSGDGAFYIGQCLNCSALIENVVGTWSYLGYTGTNATGVVIRDSVFTHNAIGVAPNTLPTEELGPNRGTMIVNNQIFNNNYDSIPGAGFSDPEDQPVGVEIGTGVWLPGVENNVVVGNRIWNHNSYGVLVSQSIDTDLPMNNTVWNNWIRDYDANDDGYGYPLAYDGTGGMNCWMLNDFEGETGPPEIETLYPCDARVPGTPYPPVQAHLVTSAGQAQTRPQEEPPDPKRPRCQRGKPGCNR
jgi:plastocyanin